MQSAHAAAWSEEPAQEPVIAEKPAAVFVVFRDGPDFVTAEKRLVGREGASRYFTAKRWEPGEFQAMARFLKKPVAELRAEAPKFSQLPANFWREVVRST